MSHYQLEDGSGSILLEDGSYLLLEGNGVAVADSGQSTGGWFSHYETELSRRRRLRNEQAEREAETEEIQDRIDREIAELFRLQEAKDERRLELERLSALVKSNQDVESIRQYGDRVVKAYERALVQGNYSALEALDREIGRAREEDEFLVLSMLFLLN